MFTFFLVVKPINRRNIRARGSVMYQNGSTNTA